MLPPSNVAEQRTLRASHNPGGVPLTRGMDPGQTLAVVRGPLEGTFDVLLVPLEGEPRPFIKSPGTERWLSFSPDGTWLAYGSDESCALLPRPGACGRFARHVALNGS